MPEWLTKAMRPTAAPDLTVVVVRLFAALAFGWAIALTYRLTQRSRDDFRSAFAVTLVMLTVILSMITQVIGENVALAFSLVGSLAVVRFRTPVNDTRDTAYVILAVAIGMAAGAGMFEIALIAIPLVGLAASLLPVVSLGWLRANGSYRLVVRVDRLADSDEVLGPIFAKYVQTSRFDGSESAQKGVDLDLLYVVRLRENVTESALVRELLAVPGVKAVEFRRLR
jgi:uncharacterized membrane protein YhiD involved in acid resistance